MRYIPGIYFLSLATLVSCSVGPKYQAADIDVVFEWKNQKEVSDEAFETDENGTLVYLDYWWEVFEDQKLEELEAYALQNNRNLLMAFERVQEARAFMGVQAADFYPQATVNPLFQNIVELDKNYRQAGTGICCPAQANTLFTPFRVHEVFYSLPFNLSYEVDLWGKIRDRYASACYSWRAQQKDYEWVMLQLTSDVAIAYYELRSLDSELDLLTAILASRKKAFQINQDRFEEGITLYADVALAGEEVESAKALYEETLRQRKIMEDELAILLGIPASLFCMEHLPLEGLPPNIPAGIPAEMLARRPDIAEAELQTRSQHALVKEAYTGFFPDVTLTAVAGFQTPVASQFLKWFSRYWMDQTAVDQMIFDGGRVASNFRLQIDLFKELSAAYQQQVLIAFQDVEDALTNIDSYAKQYDITEKTIYWANKAYTLYYDRFKLGVIYYIDVVNTEQSLLNYQINLNTLRGLRYVATIQFIKALGGGWDLGQ